MKNKRLKTYNDTKTIQSLQKLDNIQAIANEVKGLGGTQKMSVRKWLIDGGAEYSAIENIVNLQNKASEKVSLEASKTILKITGDLKNDNSVELNSQGNININIIDRFELSNNPAK
jgi:hypothetical protein